MALPVRLTLSRKLHVIGDYHWVNSIKRVSLSPYLTEETLLRKSATAFLTVEHRVPYDAENSASYLLSCT